MFDTIDRVATGDIRTKIRDILGAFMFGGEASDKKVKVLSGGEKTRLAMIRLLLEPVNLLILDEPTNHLDMKTKDILKDAIKAFDGTVIVVSHDRDFLDGLVDKVYEFGGGKVRENLGGIYDFLNKKQLDTLQQLELSRNERRQAQTAQPASNAAPAHEASAAPAKSGKLSYAEAKERDRLLRRAQKAVEKAEEDIAKLEADIAEVENQLSQGDSSPETLEQYAALTKKLENAMSVWEIAQQDYDELKAKMGL